MSGKAKNGAKARRITVNTLIYIFLSVFAVIWVFPFFYLIAQSLRGDTTGISTTIFPKTFSGFTIDNYIKLFTDNVYNFGRWYLNTFIIAAMTSVVQTILVLMTAYALSRLRFKLRRPLMQMMLIIGMFPGFLGMICIYKILQAINLQTSVFGLFIVYISGSAMGYYISKGYFDTISRSLDEAAMIDGASRNTIFWKIILPLSKPIVVYTFLTAFIGPWGDFMMASYLVGRGTSDSFTVAVGLQQWLTASKTGTYFTRFCAGGVFVSIPIVILFFWLQRYYVEGVTGGAVKG
jgi:arabinogalactan oligomer/maltooligosaccharide transport system permease protein